MPRSYLIHTPEEIIRIRRAAQASGWLRDQLAAVARPGMSTWELDQAAGALIRETGGKSAFLNYCGYPGNVCISLNDEVVHGIGVPDRIIQDDDLVSIDVGVAIDGAVGDTALTFTFAHLPFTAVICLREIQIVAQRPLYLSGFTCCYATT